MRIERTQVVKAPREQVFQAWADYEAVPKWQMRCERLKATYELAKTGTVELNLESSANYSDLSL